MTKKDKLKGVNPMAYPGLEDMNHIIPISMVWDEVVKYFGFSSEKLRAKSSKRELIVARHTFYYLAKMHTNSTFGYIGEFASGEGFNFTHATVWTAIKKVDAIMPYQPEYRNAISFINEALKARKSGG